MFLEINLTKIWGIYRSKRVQTFHHKLSHCSVTFVDPLLGNFIFPCLEERMG